MEITVEDAFKYKLWEKPGTWVVIRTPELGEDLCCAWWIEESVHSKHIGEYEVIFADNDDTPDWAFLKPGELVHIVIDPDTMDDEFAIIQKDLDECEARLDNLLYELRRCKTPDDYTLIRTDTLKRMLEELYGK